MNKTYIYILGIAGKFIGIHVLIFCSLLGLFYLLVGIPIYYSYDSGLEGLEIVFLYLFYSTVILPLNIMNLRQKILYRKNVEIYQIYMRTAYILLMPGIVFLLLVFIIPIITMFNHTSA